MGRTQTIPLDFTRGVNEQYESSSMPEGFALTLQNWVPEANGTLRVPRAFRSASTGGIANVAPTRGIGGYVISGVRSLAVGRANDATTYKVRSIVQDDISSGTWATADTITATATDLPLAFASGVGRLLYCSPTFNPLRIRYWDGAVAGETASDLIAGRALRFHSNRFFVGGIASEPTRLRWSDLGSATSWTVGTNFQDIGDDDGEPLEDFATYDRALFVGKESSIWYVTGTGPDNFAFRQADGGGVAPGRTLVPTPDGIIAIGRDRVFMLTGSGFEPISRPIESSYGMTGDYMTGCYIDGVVYICDEASGTIFRFDLSSGAWSTYSVDDVDEGPNSVAAVGPYLLAGTLNATSNAPLLYRAEPGEDRGLCSHTGQTFTWSTGELWLTGPSKPYSAMHLNLLIRQRGGDASGEPMYLSVYEGTEQTYGPEEIQPKDDLGTFRVSKSLGRAGKYAMRVEVTQTLSVTDTTLMDIERAELVVQTDENR